MPIRMSGMVSGLDTDAIIKELMSAQSMKKTAIEQKKEKLNWKKEKWEEMNTKVYSLYTEKLSALKLQGTYLAKKATSSDESKVKATATTATNGSYQLKVDSLASAEYITGADISSKNLKKDSLLGEAGMNVGQKITVKTGKNLDNVTEIEITNETTLGGLVDKLKSAGLNASFDEKGGRFHISASEAGADGKFTITSDAAAGTGLEVLGLENIDETLATTGRTASGTGEMAVVAAKDASVVLNGAVITSSNNTIQANGLSLELLGVTNGNEINITIGNDTDAVYDKVKDFVKSYNELLTDMYEKYNASSARGYSMLTDEEKEAMTEDQVKLWEDKIKDSLLRRDDTLNSLMTAFRTSMQGTVEIDGKNYSLSSFGIVTGTYTENGLLHIKGDADDAEYSSQKDQLRTAIENDPEGTAKALSKLMSGFYDTLTQKMSVSSISSALTFYNDKQMQTQMDDYEKQITNWEKRLTEMEDRYYKQFSGMEKSMADLQTKQNQMSGLLGM